MADAPRRRVRLPKDIPDAAPDEKSREELEQTSRMRDIEIQRAQHRLKSEEQDVSERKTYANKIFKLICVWLLAVFCILAVQGSNCGFELSDAVLLALIGGTTANVLGIFVIVAQYLFPKH